MDSRPQHHAIQFGRTEIRFALYFTSRERLRITVRPDMEILVEAPSGRPMPAIEKRVRRRAPWILRQLEHFRRFQPLPAPRRYVGGETHVYLGRQYRLKLIAAEREEVKLQRGLFCVHLKDTRDAARVERLMKRWFASHAGRVLEDRLARRQEALRRFGIPEPERVIFRHMQKRWGSCSERGTVVLNTALAHASLPCIDYVITHELCHLVVPNHGREFWHLLGQCMPDWPRWKERLEQTYST